MPQRDDLLFFGRISASVSHELKNVLAVMNEQAGLLEDLAAMAGKGMPLDPERLAATAACLQRQVRRGDALLTHFNRFAHTPDAAERAISLPEAANLAVALACRQAGMRKVELSALPGDAATVTADPFLLCRLLAWCLDVALERPGPEHAITVASRADADGPALAVSGLDPDAPAPDGDDGRALAQGLGAHLDMLPGSIRIVWPTA
ncbi:sensor histidine kinase [Solidesulfovibrio sp. C21]|uniref:sensor histidine kinase n=1 Tax=Solidesulfovibrio sp. C21 TaxID=3398613 RepID=UPI0039FC6B40